MERETIMSSSQYPLREKRKKQNRTGLVVAAIDLFTERGPSGWEQGAGKQ